MLEPKADYDELLSAVGRRLQPNAIRKLTLLLGNKEVISLAAGAPSFETFPLEELAEISARVIRVAVRPNAGTKHSGRSRSRHPSLARHRRMQAVRDRDDNRLAARTRSHLTSAARPGRRGASRASELHRRNHRAAQRTS